MKLIVFLTLFLSFVSPICPSLFAQERVVIYVQSSTLRGEELIPCEALTRYLNQKSRKYLFSCQFESPETILSDTYKRAYILIIDPVVFTELKMKLLEHEDFGLFPLFNICNSKFAHNCLHGAVFITKKTSTIEKLEDLKEGKIGVSSKFSSSFSLSLYEFKKAGINPRDLKIRFLGSHDKVIEEILAGTIDAGAIRTGIIENLRKEGDSRVRDLRIIHQKSVADFPLLLSTELIPDNYIVYTRTAPPELLGELNRILLPLVNTGKPIPNSSLYLYLPLDPFKLQLIQRELLLGPFESFKKHLERQKTFFLILFLLIIILLCSVFVFIFLLYRKNKQYRKEIEESNRLLEEMLQEKSSSLKRTTELLRAEMRKLEGIIESVDSGLALVDDKNKILKINQAFQKILGKPLFYLIGRDLKDVFFNQEEQRDLQYMKLLLQPTFNIKINYQIESEIKFLEVKKVPLLKEKLFLISVRDITHQKKWEEELIKFSQLETLRVVASGLAHDLNNLLGAILNNVELILLSSKNDLPATTRDRIETIKGICLRAKSLTQELLVYGKSLVLSVDTYSLPELLEETVQFSLAGSAIKVLYSFDPRAQFITGDKNLLSVALHNIIINAREAMKERGTLRITTELRKPAILISISDDGPGIPPEYLRKLFTPFFTTKPGGSGLGLFSAKRIIEAHNGKIEIDSAPDKGTTVRIYLPYVEPTRCPSTEVKKDIDRSEVLKGSKNGRPRILLMDDEREIRESLRDLLEAFDYEVTACENGEEAVEILRKDASYDIAILDLTVPGRYDGISTLRELKKIKPSIKGILATGYAYKRETVDVKALGFEEVLIKPYTIEALLAVLEKISPRKDTHS